MRRLAARFHQLLLGVTGAVALLTPTLAIAAWSAVYLWQCGQTALAPGLPIVYKYESASGEVRVVAESFIVEPGSQAAEALNVSLSGPSGRVLNADRMLVQRLPSGGLEINLSGIEAFIERGADGHFSFESILPKEEKPGGPMPAYHLFGQRLRLTLRDVNKSGGESVLITAPRIEVSGQGNNFTLVSKIDLPGLTGTNLRYANHDNKAYALDLGLNRADFSRILPFATRFFGEKERQQFAKFSIDRSDLSGDLRVEGELGRDGRVYGPLKGTIAGIGFADHVSGGNASVDLLLRGSAVSGKVIGTANSTKFSLDGALDWTKSLKAASLIHAEIPDLRKLPAAWRKGLDSTFTLRGGEFTGAGYIESSTYGVSGKVNAATMSLRDQTLDHAAAEVVVDPKAISVRNLTAIYLGSNVRAAAEIDLKGRLVRGFANAASVDLGRVAKSFGETGVAGRGSVDLQVDGPLQAPKFVVQTTGSATYESKQLAEPIRGDLELRAKGDLNNVTITRAVLKSDQGVFAVEGDLSQKNHLNLLVRGTGVRLSSINKRLSGEGFMIGRVTGTLTAPVASADLEAIKFQVGDVVVPYIRLTANLKSNLLSVPNLIADYGLTKATAAFEINVKEGSIKGRFASDGIQLAELLPDESAIGMVKVQDGVLGGTLESPTYSARIVSEMVALGNSWISRGIARLHGDQSGFEIDRGLAFFDPSTITSSLSESELKAFESFKSGDAAPTGAVALAGGLQFDKMQGKWTLAWNDVPINPLYRGDPRAKFDGRSSGTGNFEIAEGKVKTANSDFSLSDLSLNGGSIGYGQFKVTANGGKWTAEGAAGQITPTDPRFIELKGVQYNETTNTAQGSIVATNLQTETLLRLGQPLLEGADSDTKRILSDFSALLNGELTATWDGKDLSLNIPQAELSNLHILGRSDGGTVSVKGLNRTGSEWAMDTLTWITGQTRMTASGTFNEKDESLNLEAQANQIDLGWVLAYNPESPVIPATLNDLDLILHGKVSNPVVQGNVTIKGLQRDTIDAQGNTVPGPEAPSIMFYGIELSNNLLVSNHQFKAYGFTGEGTVKGDVRALFSTADARPTDQDIEFTASANNRPISDFKDFLNAIDFANSSATVGADFRIRGNIDHYAINARAELQGPKLAFKSSDTSLLDPDLKLTIADQVVSLDTIATSSKGGLLTGHASFDQPAKLDQPLDALMSSTIMRPGSEFRFDNFSIAQFDPKLNQKTNLLVHTDNAITITGSLASPLFAGKIGLNSLDSDVPQLPQGGAPISSLLMNPRFDLDIETTSMAQVRAGLVVLNGRGQTHIAGDFLQPTVTGEFMVDNGIMKLPNARVELENGGKIEIGFRTMAGGQSLFQAPVHLTGRSSLTARSKFSTTYERYDIRMNIDGDLASPDPLSIHATADPGDLTEPEILAIIGQQDLVESLANLARDVRSDQLRNTFFTYALPRLADGLTKGIASALELDYLELEYNPFDGPTIVGAKSINRAISIQVRRRFESNQYLGNFNEVKLVYRVPSSNPLLSHARFTLSSATKRPTRLAFEYSIRF